jgi:hypothetical protein
VAEQLEGIRSGISAWARSAELGDEAGRVWIGTVWEGMESSRLMRTLNEA